MEALAYGLPVLAANATALPEVLAGHGWLLPPEQPPAWADAIQAVLAASTDAEQDSSSSARRAYATSAFSWRATAATYVQTWRSLSSSEG
jgi:glycosyltransferase involved in cell wall biosynthesis